MELSPNNVVLGDCIQRLQQVSPGSIDLVFADPPFNIGYEYDVYDDRRANEEYLDWSRQWIKGVYESLKPTGTFWLAIGDEYAAELKLIAQETGFTCRSWVIWYYTFGVNCVRGFSRSHTHLFHFVKDPEEFTFNGDNPEVRVMSARQLVYADGRANPKGRLPDNTWIYRPQDAPSSFAPHHDTWYFSRVAGTFNERQGFHGCQMPEQLLGRIIRISSCPLETVLDPFSGSGTTLAVAKKLGRQWLGFDVSHQYVQAVQERLDSVAVGDPLNGPENPLSSAPKTAKGRKNVRVRNGRPLPTADEKTIQGIIEAFQQAGQGFSADALLCDPELNQEFIAKCKSLRLHGTGFVWNRVLLRLRKSGRLPKANQKGRRLTFEEMDGYSFASEIAMRLSELDYGLGIDDVLCSPDALAEFDRLAAEYAPGHAPFEYRWAALAVRKRAKKAKALAVEQFGKWLTKKLPPPLPISDYRAKSELQGKQASGVYLLASDRLPLYVGESCDVGARLEQAMSCASWSRLGLSCFTFLPRPDKKLPGLQSILIGRFEPLLNTQLLAPELPHGELPARLPNRPPTR